MQIKLRVSKFPITCSSSKRKLKKKGKIQKFFPQTNLLGIHSNFSKEIIQTERDGETN
jgi:hypothetical protein